MNCTARIVIGLVGALVLSGCQESSTPVPEPDRPVPAITVPPASGPSVPITPRAVGALALSVLPGSTASRSSFPLEKAEVKAGVVRVDLKYRDNPVSDIFGSGDFGDNEGAALDVAIYPRGYLELCGPPAECAKLSPAPSDSPVTLVWTTEEPDEDPGEVRVAQTRADGTVVMVTSGLDKITGDPRKQRLTVSIDAMREIATNPRLAPATDQAVIDAGQRLRQWDASNDPGNDKHVAQTNLGLTNEPLFYTEYLPHFISREVSPFVPNLGEGGQGGRLHLGKGAVWKDHPATIDVLAAPRMPSFLATDPCLTPKFAGHCEPTTVYQGEEPEPPFGYEAWVPTSSTQPGEVWMISVRDDDVAMIRIKGGPVGESYEDVDNKIGRWDLVYSDLLGAVGPRTYESHRDFDPRPDPPIED